jgi:glycosyltransferase involved in cell wall biosynthesis
MTIANASQARIGNGLHWFGSQISGTRGTKGVSEHVVAHLRLRGWIVYTASSHENRLLRLADMLISALKHRQQYVVGIVDVYSGLAFRYAEIVSWFLCLMGKNVVLTLHGGGLLDFARDHPKRLRRLLQRGHRVVTPSHFLRSGLAGMRPDIDYLPNGLDCNQFAYRTRTSANPKLCWVRAFHKIYNPVMAVECLASLGADFPGARLRMVGPDSNDGSLALVRERAQGLGIQEALDVSGAVPNNHLPTELQMSDIFLNTTNYESFGVSVMEAAACGLCIVTTNVGELGLLWEQGQDALLVSPDDPQGMAAAVRRILTEPGLAERLSRNARAKAEQFDWSAILPQWERLLSDVARAAADRRSECQLPASVR